MPTISIDDINFKVAIGSQCVFAEGNVYIKIDEERYETISEDTMRKLAEEAREKASMRPPRVKSNKKRGAA